MVKKVFTRHPLPHTTAPIERKDAFSDIDEEEELPEGGSKLVIVVFIVLIGLGIGTGYVLSQKFSGGTTVTTNGTTTVSTNGKKSVGVSDTSTFKDSATGTIEAGGMSGEGTHQLVRDGGPSQTVYLISSVVDLDQFVGKKVTVWGQTMAAKKVPWLMDVGRVDTE